MAVNYPDKNNPFYTEEDDRFGFGGGGGQGTTYGASGGGFGTDWDPADDDWGKPRSKADQIQDLKQNSMNRQLESTQKAMGSIYESERMGIATAEVSEVHSWRFYIKSVSDSYTRVLVMKASVDPGGGGELVGGGGVRISACASWPRPLSPYYGALGR